MAANPDASSTPAATPYDGSTPSKILSYDVQESDHELKAKDESEVEPSGCIEQSEEDSERKGRLRDSLIRQEAQELGGMLNLLYKACEEGDLAPLQFLLRQMGQNFDLSVAKFSDGGLTPLHVASNKGHQEMVRFLLDKGASPMAEDEARNTPLHLAATHGHLEVAMLLLAHESQRNEEACESVRSNLLHVTNTNGLSPFGCAIKAPEPHFHVAKEFLNVVCGNPANAIPDFSKLQPFSKFATVPLDKPAKIFVVGDSMAGKSTLVKSLQEGKSGFSRLLIGLIASKMVTNIDEHFSGIITTDFANADFRRVLFHDLAGHTNYFNESLLEPNDSLEHTVFIVVVDLRYNPQKAEERLIYWLNFLHYHTYRLANENTKPSIVVVGSHKDMKRGVWRSGEKFNEVYTEALKKRPQLSNYFNQLMKPVSLDCRRFEVSEARQLRSCLQKHCQNSIYLQLEATLPPSICYVLSQVLFDSKEFPPYLNLSNFAQKISDLAKKPGLSLYKLLPTEPSKLMEICKTLHKHDRLMIVNNPVSSSDLYHWIIHDIHALLTEIDKRLATLKNALSGSSDDLEATDYVVQQDMGHSFHHLGIVTREKLESVFSGSRKPSRIGSASSAHKVSEPSPVTPSSTTSSATSSLSLNSNLAVELLLKYKYCETITSNDPVFSDESFFFPGLLQDEVGEPDPWELGTNYSFAWCVVPHPQDDKVIEFFLPRFLKKLLLCFIEKYIIHHRPKNQDQQEQDDISSMSSSNESSVVWSRGMSWSTSDDIKINIELTDCAIILSMYSQEGSELNCLQLRNKILATIKDEKKKWQPEIAINEFIIPFGDKFPVQMKTLDIHRRIPLESVEKAILKGKPRVDEVDLKSFLFFEPCIAISRLTKPLWDAISNPNQSSELSQENISEIFDELGKEFIQHFNLHDHRSDSTPQPHTSSTQSSTTDNEEVSAPASLPDSQMTSCATSSQLAEPNVKAHESNKRSITTSKLLECMNSISIMDTMEFLQQLANHPSSTTPSEASLQERDEIQLDSGDRKDSTLKRSHHQHNTFTLSDSDLPFIEPPTVLQCSSEQQVYHSKKYGIKLVFPSGAVIKGTLDVEIGILLSGPFTLPANVKPVSPILWLCVKEDQSHKFSKPINITIPHFMDCISQEEQNKFAFLKATHSDSVTDGSFTFKEAAIDRCKFLPSSGILTTRHCRLVCIAYKEPKNMIDKSNYSLISVIPRRIVQPKFTMYYCLTFNLKTYIEVLQSQFPDCEVSAKTVFKFAKDSIEQQQQRAITIRFNTHLPQGWIIANSGFDSKIAASNIDFYSNTFGYLRHLEEEEYYPPRFAIEVNGSSATKADILCVTFEGAIDELKIEKTLTVIHKQLSGSQSLDRVFTDDPQDWTRQQSSSVSSLHSRNTSTQSIPAAIILERHLDILIQYLNVDLIRPVLRKYGVLLPGEADKLIDLGNHPGTSHRSIIEKLVTLLSSKGASGIYYFKKTLEETTEAMGHQDILKELSKDQDFEAIINDACNTGN